MSLRKVEKVEDPVAGVSFVHEEARAEGFETTEHRRLLYSYSEGLKGGHGEEEDLEEYEEDADGGFGENEEEVLEDEYEEVESNEDADGGFDDSDAEAAPVKMFEAKTAALKFYDRFSNPGAVARHVAQRYGPDGEALKKAEEPSKQVGMGIGDNKNYDGDDDDLALRDPKAFLNKLKSKGKTKPPQQQQQGTKLKTKMKKMTDDEKVQASIKSFKVVKLHRAHALSLVARALFRSHVADDALLQVELLQTLVAMVAKSKSKVRK